MDGIAVPIEEDEEEMLPGYLLEVRSRPPPLLLSCFLSLGDSFSLARDETADCVELSVAYDSQATIAEQGLGVTGWWPTGDEDAAEAETMEVES